MHVEPQEKEGGLSLRNNPFFVKDVRPLLYGLLELAPVSVEVV